MNIKEYIRVFLIGMAMGVANIIPGVSGGTIAVVFGIYEKLMEALGNFVTDKQNRKNHIVFLTVLFSGSLVAIVALAGLLTWAYESYPLITVYFFMGLILGSIPVVIKSHDDMKLSKSRGISLIIGIALVVILAVIQSSRSGASSSATISQFSDYAFLDYSYFMLCGAIAASAMIIPGVSGSFVLILLGAYWTVLGALSGLPNQIVNIGFSDQVIIRIMILISLFVGVVIGILGFSRIMNWAIKNYPAVTMYGILGLIIGSFYQIYPGFELTLNGLGAVTSAIIGLVISIRFSKT